MKISLRGWLILGIFAAAVAGVLALSLPFAGAAPLRPVRSGELTEASLGELLASMGIEAKKKEHRYDFSFKAMYEQQEWNLSMSAVLSRNGKSLWVMAWLDELPRSAADVPRVALLRLLSENDRMGNGKFFAYISGNRRFVLERVVPNEKITSASLREVLRDLGASVAETYPHWSVSNWKNSTEGEPATGPSHPGSKSAARSRRTARP